MTIHHHEHRVTQENEQKTLLVIIFTVVTMIAEITYGYLTNSMALLADGYHMGTHALALSLTYAAYLLMRLYGNSAKFPCGTEKIGILAAYTSAIFLGLTGFWIVAEATQRLFNPQQIAFSEAISVAVIGLIVNAVCIKIMENGHHHRQKQNEHLEKNDYNFQAAYYHILADVLTSVLAIAALIIGKYTGIFYLDALIGALGGLLILRWAKKLLKYTIVILIEMKEE